MNPLDEMFGEALERQALDTTATQRAAVADVTVQGARRHRRARAGVQAVVAVAVVGFAAVIGSLALGQGEVAPAEPTPTLTQPQPDVTTEPNLDYASVIDERFAQAPQMDANDWANVTLGWDAEIASFIGGGKEGFGSVVAIYLTPPGGSRMLAYATANTDMVSPILLAFDASTRSVMLIDQPASGGVSTLNLETGLIGEVALFLDEPTSTFVPLGKLSNGDSLFVVSTVDSNSEYTWHVFRTFNNTAVPVIEGRFSLSTVWNDRFVVIQDGEFTFVDADGTPPPSIDGADGCDFASWNTDGSFVAICGASQTHTGTYVQVDPDTGEVATLWEDAEWETGSAMPESLTEDHALDGVRSWRSELANSLPYAPPVLYSDGVQVADLADGFGEPPAGYGVIFGARG